MKTYKTLATVELFTGRIGLADDQAEPRRLKLENVKKDIYEIVAPVQFKAGEIIRLEVVPKSIKILLEPVKTKKKGKKHVPKQPTDK